MQVLVHRRLVTSVNDLNFITFLIEDLISSSNCIVLVLSSIYSLCAHILKYYFLCTPILRLFQISSSLLLMF